MISLLPPHCLGSLAGIIVSNRNVRIDLQSLFDDSHTLGSTDHCFGSFMELQYGNKDDQKQTTLLQNSM